MSPTKHIVRRKEAKKKKNGRTERGTEKSGREADTQHYQLSISPGPQHDPSSLTSDAAARKYYTERVLLPRCFTNSSGGTD